MKNTALTSVHEELGAKMAPFAGYSMPVSYEGVNAEHQTVRESVGVFDVSHMGEFLIEGPEALALIQQVTSNDASKLVDGQAAEDTETVVVITKELEVAKPLAALIAEVGLTFRTAHMIAAFAPLNENLETEQTIKLMLK